MTILQEQETQDITLLSRGLPDLSIAHKALVGHGGGGCGGSGGVQCDDGGGQQEGDDVLLHYSIRNTLCLMPSLLLYPAPHSTHRIPACVTV